MEIAVLMLISVPFIAGALIWLCVRLVPPNTLAIPVFLGGKRLNMILKEGLHVLPPFCNLIHHSMKPRERVPFNIAVNVLNDTVYCTGTFGFQLLPPKEMKDKGYLLIYDTQQEKIETDAKAKLFEMLDEMLAAIPAECALSKKMNDAVQLAVTKGIKYQVPKNGNQTAEEKIIEIATTHKKEYIEKMKERDVIVSDTSIPLPEKKDVSEQDARGLEQIFLEDYGVKLTVNTLALEPNPKTAETRSKLWQRDLERDMEYMDTKLVLAMIKRVMKDTATCGEDGKIIKEGLSDREARDLVMVVQDYYQKPEAQRIDIDLKGLENIPAETMLALGKMYMTNQINRGGKGKGGKKQI